MRVSAGTVYSYVSGTLICLVWKWVIIVRVQSTREFQNQSQDNCDYHN